MPATESELLFPGELCNLAAVVILVRLLIEILLLAVVVALAWEKPYHERVGELIPALRSQAQRTTTISPSGRPPASSAPPQMTSSQSAVSQPLVTPAATSSGSWMWDPNRTRTLDRPGTTPIPPTFTNHIYYTDEKGKKYWLDAQGQRHYQP